MTTQIWFRVENIERPTHRLKNRSIIVPSYRWVTGFAQLSADGKRLYPASTKQEARDAARQDGDRIVFCETIEEARAALDKIKAATLKQARGEK